GFSWQRGLSGTWRYYSHRQTLWTPDWRTLPRKGGVIFPWNFGFSKTNLVGLSYSREAKLLCKKIVSFFSLLSKTQETGVRKLGVTQELLSLVTGLAHYLKLLIRISLQGALKLEREARH